MSVKLELLLNGRTGKRLPDPNGPLSSIIPTEVIRNANGAHGQSRVVKVSDHEARM